MAEHDDEDLLRLLSERRCPRCTYDLRGIGLAPCPECGFLLRADETVLFVRRPLERLRGTFMTIFLTVALVLIITRVLPGRSSVEQLGSVAFLGYMIVSTVVAHVRRANDPLARLNQIWLSSEGIGFVTEPAHDRFGTWIESICGIAAGAALSCVSFTVISPLHRLNLWLVIVSIVGAATWVWSGRSPRSKDGVRPIFATWRMMPPVEIQSGRKATTNVIVYPPRPSKEKPVTLLLAGSDRFADALAEQIAEVWTRYNLVRTGSTPTQ